MPRRSGVEHFDQVPLGVPDEEDGGPALGGPRRAQRLHVVREAVVERLHVVDREPEVRRPGAVEFRRVGALLARRLVFNELDYRAAGVEVGERGRRAVDFYAETLDLDVVAEFAVGDDVEV